MTFSSQSDLAATLRAIQGGSDSAAGSHLYRTLLDTSGCIVLFLGVDGTILDLNPEAERVYGRPLADVQGKDYCAEFLPERVRDAVREQIRNVVAGQRVTGYENPVLAHDGSERLFRWNSVSLGDESGAAIGLIAIGQDVTMHRRAVAQLENVLESVLDPVIGIDRAGTVVTCNPAIEKVFGWTAAVLTGQNVKVLMGEPYRSEHDDYLRAYLETGIKKAIGTIRNVVGRRRSGEDFPCEISIAEIAEPDAVHFVGVVRDNSEKKAMSLRLTQAERLAAVGELAAGVAHEINNPVNTIINCVQLLKDGDDDPTLLDDITQEGMRIASIVRDLLDFARDHGDEHSPTRIQDVIERTLSLISHRLARQGIEMDVAVETDVPTFKGRSQQLQQVLLNLLLNARDALVADKRDRPKRIRVEAMWRDAEGEPVVEVRVRDNGPGISAEAIDRIFQPFFTTKRDSGGTGLGLAVSLGIVQHHNGTLRVSSEPGEFTEFVMTLPVDNGWENGEGE